MNELPQRFWDKIEYDTNGGCWFWSGGLAKGYGYFKHEGKWKGAHRLAYTKLVGPLPTTLEPDHLCRIRCCVNPAHMEPVSRKENLERSPLYTGNRTHCPKGHEYTLENTLLEINVKGYTVRRCRTCRSKKVRRRKGA